MINTLKQKYGGESQDADNGRKSKNWPEIEVEEQFLQNNIS